MVEHRSRNYPCTLSFCNAQSFSFQSTMFMQIFFKIASSFVRWTVLFGCHTWFPTKECFLRHTTAHMAIDSIFVTKPYHVTLHGFFHGRSLTFQTHVTCGMAMLLIFQTLCVGVHTTFWKFSMPCLVDEFHAVRTMTDAVIADRYLTDQCHYRPKTRDW